jgi:hypothetical protein
MQIRWITASSFSPIWETPIVPTTHTEHTATVTRSLLLAFPPSCSRSVSSNSFTALVLYHRTLTRAPQVADRGADGCFDISAFATTEFLGLPGAPQPRTPSNIRVTGRVVSSGDVPDSWQVSD